MFHDISPFPGLTPLVCVNGEQMAAKLVPCHGVDLPELRREAHLQGLASDSPFVCGVAGSFINEGYFCLVSELCVTDLFDLVASNRGLSLECIQYIGAATLSAVNHLHSLQISHCDLKAENIGVDAMGRPKLLDFGLAVTGTAVMSGRRGTMHVNMPPEMMLLERFLPQLVDMYGLGGLLFFSYTASVFMVSTEELCRLSMDGLTAVICERHQRTDAIVRMRTQRFPSQLRDVISHCCRANWQMRATPSQLMEHPSQ